MIASLVNKLMNANDLVNNFRIQENVKYRREKHFSMKQKRVNKRSPPMKDCDDCLPRNVLALALRKRFSFCGIHHKETLGTEM